MRRVLLLIACLGVGAGGVVAVGAACSEPPTVSFGNPNTLARENLPGEGGIVELVCAGDAGAGFDGGCPSFKTDIYPYFAIGGPWHCGDRACHGGTTDPAIDSGTSEACLTSLRKIAVTGVVYVPSDGGKDPNASSILCNLQGACGSKMPEPPGTDPLDSDLCKIQAWLSCGAPDN